MSLIFPQVTKTSTFSSFADSLGLVGGNMDHRYYESTSFVGDGSSALVSSSTHSAQSGSVPFNSAELARPHGSRGGGGSGRHRGTSGRELGQTFFDISDFVNLNFVVSPFLKQLHHNVA